MQIAGREERKTRVSGRECGGHIMYLSSLSMSTAVRKASTDKGSWNTGLHASQNITVTPSRGTTLKEYQKWFQFQTYTSFEEGFEFTEVLSLLANHVRNKWQGRTSWERTTDLLSWHSIMKAANISCPHDTKAFHAKDWKQMRQVQERLRWR